MDDVQVYVGEVFFVMEKRFSRAIQLFLFDVKAVLLPASAKFAWVAHFVLSRLQVLWQPRKILNKGKFLPIFLTTVTVIAIAACADTLQLEQRQSNSTTIDIADCRTIKHAIGYTCVPNNPQRVVTLSPLALGNALVLGIKPIGSNNLVYWGERLPTYLGNKTEGIETLGTEEQSNLEKILSLKPDLIVGNNLYHEAIYPLLSNIAPTALHHFQGNIIWRDVFNFMAEVLGKQDIAQRTWNRYYQRIEELKLALGDRYQDKTISVSWFYFGRIGSNVKNSFDGSILNDVGLKRPASQDVTTDYGYIDFSEEELEKSDGDVMFVMSFTDNDEQALKQLQQRPLWNQLKAVQQNQVYFVDQLTWTGGNLLAADAVIDDLYKYLVNTP